MQNFISYNCKRHVTLQAKHIVCVSVTDVDRILLHIVI